MPLPRLPRLLAVGVAGTLAFALVHVYWAFGGRIGVPADAAPISERPVFLAYDVVSALVLFAAAVLARRLADPDPDRRVVRLATIGVALALLRGGIGVVQDAVLAVRGDGVSVGAIYDGWFVATGALFLVIVLTVRAQATGTVSSRSAISPVAPARTPRRPSTTT